MITGCPASFCYCWVEGWCWSCWWLLLYSNTQRCVEKHKCNHVTWKSCSCSLERWISVSCHGEIYSQMLSSFIGRWSSPQQCVIAETIACGEWPLTWLKCCGVRATPYGMQTSMFKRVHRCPLILQIVAVTVHVLTALIRSNGGVSGVTHFPPDGAPILENILKKYVLYGEIYNCISFD